MAKERNPKAAFGLFDYTMIPKLRRLLKPYGLALKTRRDRNNWGDQVEVTVEPIVQPNINLGSAYLSEVLKELDRNNARNRDAGEDPHNYAKGC